MNFWILLPILIRQASSISLAAAPVATPSDSIFTGGPEGIASGSGMVTLNEIYVVLLLILSVLIVWVFWNITLKVIRILTSKKF